MKLFPIRVGRRRFLDVEFFHAGWNQFAIGYSVGFDPELYLGWWILRLNED